MSIEIKGFIENTLIDWEGKIAAEIFLPYCNFQCFYCHAKALVLEPQNLETIDKNQVIEYLKSHKKWIDGLVICGGEPTIYKDLPEFIKEFKDIGVKIKLDTNGSNPDMLSKLIKDGLVDYVAMDIKAPLNQSQYSYVAKTDVNIKDIERSINIIMQSGIDYEFRTTVSKSWLSFDDLINIAKSIKGAKRYRIQKFVKREGEILEDNLDAENYSDEELDKICNELKKYIPDCRYR